MRDLTAVLGEVLCLIPKTEKHLRVSLVKIQDSAFFAPPEGMSILWREACAVLEDEIGKPTEPWQKKVQQAFSGKTTTGSRQQGATASMGNELQRLRDLADENAQLHEQVASWQTKFDEIATSKHAIARERDEAEQLCIRIADALLVILKERDPLKPWLPPSDWRERAEAIRQRRAKR